MNGSTRISSRPPLAAAMAFLLAATLLPTVAVSPARAAPSELFFSEYMEGSSNNKALEVYNGTGVAVNLASGGYNVQMFFNGSATAGLTINLTGTVATGDVYVLAQASANGSILAQADQTNNAGWFNGDDAVVLRKGTTYIDVIGQIGFDPGTEWGTGLTSTADNTLRRKDAVEAGDPDGSNVFDPSIEWDGLATDTFGGLGARSGDATPAVRSTLPANAATDVPRSASITVNFTEAVAVAGAWYSISCATSGAHTATVTGGPLSFVLDPDVDFAANEVCTATISAANITDLDTIDPPDAMAADYTFSFTTADVVLCGDPATLIHDVQGNGLSTPIPGTQVWIEGIVVGDFQGTGQFSGYYVQEEDTQADADPATSEGIFVFDTAVPVAVGDVVRVRGTVFEFNGLTELSPVSSVMLCSSGSVLPTATTVTMPFASADFPERYEGMLVQLPQSLVISEYFNYDRYGEIVLALPLDGESRPFTGTAIDEPGAPANARTLANSLRRITLDDGLSTQNPSVLRHPNGDPFSLANRFRGGDVVQNAIGVLGYDFGLYRIQPTGPAAYTAVNPRPASPEPVGGTLRVAAMNTLNFFVTADYPTGNPLDNTCGPLNNVECRGWDSDQVDEFTRQRDKLLAALTSLDADVIGLNELENTTGVEPLVSIVAGLPGYAYVNTGTIGSDAIKVGLIYRPAVVTPVGTFQTLDSNDDPRFIDTKSRPTLAQTFEENATGARFTVAVNHLKSKGSDCIDVGDPDLGDGQGNCSQTRRAAAEALVDWLATDPTGSGDPDFLIMGDLNSYAKEDTIDEILAGSDDTAGTSDDYTNLIDHFQGTYAYSYVFDGQSGYLDHALASSSIVGRVTGAADWHINADEPDVLDYDTSFKPPSQDALYEPNGYRSSDHDPVVVGLDLGIDTTATLTVEPASQQYSDQVDLVAQVTPAQATGSVQFQKSTDGGATFTDLGSPVAVSGGEATLADVQILDAAGTDVVFKALFDGTSDYLDSDDTAPLAVIHEDASVLYDAGNPVAEEVDDPGSGKWTGTLTLDIGVKERVPDNAGTGTTGIGDIANAGLSVTLVPLGSGGNIALTCVAGAVTGTGYDAVNPFTCSRTGEIPLGTYEVVTDVTGDYYTATYSDAFTVYDPSLGFATGGGRFVHDGDDTSFGFIMSYTKKGTNLKGSFIAVRHHDDGTVSRLKSNSLGGLAIFTSGSCGTATFNGRATYMTWEPTANGGLGAYVTTGNNSFAVRADDCNNPGTGTDAIWVGGPGAIGMISPAASNMAALTSGNIVVPHGVAKK